MTLHNGYFGCRVCELEGTYNSRDKTCTYPWSSFVQTHPHFRTRDRFELDLNEVDRLKDMGETNINVRGIKGRSPLNQLIFIPTQAVYDYFHLCLEVSLHLSKLIVILLNREYFLRSNATIRRLELCNYSNILQSLNK
jgi:hypothetical protein